MKTTRSAKTAVDSQIHIRKKVAGGATGALVGAAVAGPVGAVVGGVVGIVAGTLAEEPRSKAAARLQKEKVRSAPKRSRKAKAKRTRQE